jgi:hypothetical protein
MELLPKSVSGILLLWSISGCVLAPNYPVTWPKPISSNSNIEEMIVGYFKCSGKVVSGYSDNIEGHLPVFLNMEGVKKGQCDTVEFRQVKAGLLEVTAIKDGNALETKTFVAGEDYVNENGWLTLKSEGEVTNRGLILGYASGKNSFTLNMSGNLIIKSSGYGVGIMLLLPVPVAGGGHNWVMFERQSNNAIQPTQ